MGSKVPKIGVFDSGAGGLSVYQSVRQSLPGAKYFYCSDSKNFPYGPKSSEEVLHCATKACLAFVRRYELDVAIVACNTASTIALEAIRNQTSIPVVGVVPAIKPAAAMSNSGVIGLLATPGTVARPYTMDLVTQFCGKSIVHMHGSGELVALAERKLRGIEIQASEIKQAIEPLFAKDDSQKMDVVILGCTHFPLIQSELARAAPWNVTWIHSGEAIARRTVELLREGQWHYGGATIGEVTFTDVDPQMSRLVESFAQYDLSFHSLLEVNKAT